MGIKAADSIEASEDWHRGNRHPDHPTRDRSLADLVDVLGDIQTNGMAPYRQQQGLDTSDNDGDCSSSAFSMAASRFWPADTPIRSRTMGQSPGAVNVAAGFVDYRHERVPASLEIEGDLVGRGSSPPPAPGAAPDGGAAPGGSPRFADRRLRRLRAATGPGRPPSLHLPLPVGHSTSGNHEGTGEVAGLAQSPGSRAADPHPAGHLLPRQEGAVGLAGVQVVGPVAHELEPSGSRRERRRPLC